VGFKIFEWLRGSSGTGKTVEVSCRELWEAAQEYRIRELAFWSCVNLIANALSRCEFRTYLGGEEVKDADYWLWNFEPNTNENSTAFLHKLVAKLYSDNETLIIPTVKAAGGQALVVADSWTQPDRYPVRENEYRSVTVGDMTYRKTFFEQDVLHLTLNHCDVKPVIDGMYQSYVRLIGAAMNNYVWQNGQHWKVHVEQMAAGNDNWASTFQAMVEDQIRPFLNSTAAVLPELDGWKYENLSQKVDNSKDAGYIRALVTDVFTMTANAFLIPPVLLLGQVEGTKDAVSRFLTACVDPLADQLQEEITRKRYGYAGWKNGSYTRVDTSAINHFDLFANAANVEKLIGSGYSYNDVQRAAGGTEIDEPWANEHYLTKNFAKAETILKGEGNE